MIINIPNKAVFSLLFLVLLFSIGIIALAVNSPQSHDPNEIDFSIPITNDVTTSGALKAASIETSGNVIINGILKPSSIETPGDVSILGNLGAKALDIAGAIQASSLQVSGTIKANKLETLGNTKSGPITISSETAANILVLTSNDPEYTQQRFEHKGVLIGYIRADKQDKKFRIGSPWGPSSARNNNILELYSQNIDFTTDKITGLESHLKVVVDNTDKSCSLLALGSSTDGGKTGDDETWNVQCPDGKVLVGLYDDNDGFDDVDKAKCCPLSIKVT